MRYNFVPVFDTKMKKRRSIAPHLAKDANYLLKMGFELIECAPDLSENTKMESVIAHENKQKDGNAHILVDVAPIITETIEEKPKRGRPKKQ